MTLGTHTEALDIYIGPKLINKRKNEAAKHCSTVLCSQRTGSRGCRYFIRLAKLHEGTCQLLLILKDFRVLRSTIVG